MMEDAVISGFDGTSAVTRKRRSTTSRRPRPDNQFLLAGYNLSPPTLTPSWEDESGQSPDGSSGRDSSVPRKEVNLNSLVPRASAINRNEGFTASKGAKKYVTSNGEYGESCYSAVSRLGSSASDASKKSLLELNQSSDKVLVTANWKSSNKRREHSSVDIHIDGGRNDVNARIVGNSEGAPNGSAENKLRKVKLKLGGVTRMIHAKSKMEGNADGGSSTKLPFPSDAPQRREKYIVLDNSNDHHSLKEKVDALQGSPWEDDKPQSMIASEPVRKSRRVPKRRVLDEASDDEDEDDEIRFLEKLKASKISADHSAQHETGGSEGTTKQKSSRIHNRASFEEEGDFSLSCRTTEHRRRSRPEMDSEDMDYIEEEEAESDVSEAMRKKQRKEPLDSLIDGRKEMSLTTRQRALQSAKDGSGGSSTSLIEFPNGLPPAPPRKQKEKLSEVEQQLKKAEAAQRRRIQVEKAARESEAEAIRKILGQDSSRKRREEKLQKKRDELAQEKAAKSLEQASNTVRWIMGPSGTTVTFPDGVDLPSIFNSKPCSYPPAREKCAGPSCTNAYRYRDSKSNLPLCSLQCYRAVQQSAQLVKIC